MASISGLNAHRIMTGTNSGLALLSRMFFYEVLNVTLYRKALLSRLICTMIPEKTATVTYMHPTRRRSTMIRSETPTTSCPSDLRHKRIQKEVKKL